jgi:hypothetical protein
MYCEYTLYGHLDLVRSLVDIPNMDALASTGQDYKIKLWNT